MEFESVVLFCNIFINLFKILDQVYLSLFERLFDTLEINGPPTTDETLVLLINTDLWDLIYLTWGIILQKSYDLIILVTIILFEIMISNFHNIKCKILIVNFFLEFLFYFVGIKVFLLVNIQILILTCLCYQIVWLCLLLVLWNKSLISFYEIINESPADKSRVFISKQVFDVGNLNFFVLIIDLTNLRFDMLTIIFIHLSKSFLLL